MRLVAKLAALGVGIGLGASGCGSGALIVALSSPTISGVSPQVVTAGTPSVTVTVQGANFESQSSVTVDGAVVPTTVVNSTTLAAKLSGTTLAKPAVAKVQVKNGSGAASNELPFTIQSLTTQAPTAPTITTTSLPGGQAGAVYNASLAASGGTPAYTWTLTAGSLPAGVTFSSGGVLTGTPATSGSFSFTVQVADASSPAQTQTVILSITVTAGATTTTALSVVPGGLSAGGVGSVYSGSVSASGGTPGYTWTVASGSLPAGLTLSGTGLITGTPTASGTSSFTVTATDSGSPVQTASALESIVVSPSSVAIGGGSLSAGKVGVSYGASLSASGGTPGYTWKIASGNLPAGLTLSSAGMISGTPTAAGSSSFTVAATDNGLPAQGASTPETITISPATLAITPGSLSAGKTGNSYAATLAASGGTPGYTWTVASGSLPAGLTLSGAGAISGLPAAAGTFAFTVQVADSGSPAQTASAQESITVAATALVFNPVSLAAGKTGSAYSATVSATGGTPGYSYTVTSGSLPAGLTLSSGGVISGDPTAAGTATFTVQATDSSTPAQTASVQESIAVTTPPALVVTSTSLGAAETGSSYSTTLNATGGTPGYTWTVTTGSLPPGLSLSSAGVISGAPTTVGAYAFTVTASDSATPAQTASVAESIAVTLPPLTVTTTVLSAGTVASNYSTTLAATGGTTAYSWTVSAGSLPDGLTLSSAGVISGTATTAATATFTVTVTDSESPAQTATAQESIAIEPASTYTNPAGSAKLYLYPAAPVAPRGTYQSVTAIVNGVNDKTVTWTADGGTIVGTNPCVVNEPCTVALYTTTPGTYHLTATSNADSTAVATSTITITASPTPATTHPRLGGVTAAMLPAMQAKAVSSNSVYLQMYSNAVAAFNRDDAIWAWSCNGGSGMPNTDQTETYKEQDAYLFAFMSMIDPSNPTYKWGCYGRDMWVYYANFWLNPLSDAYSAATLSSRQVDSNYGLTGNHGSDSTEDLTLTPDWLMAGGFLSDADKAVTRQYFALAAEQMAVHLGTGIRAPIGNYNSDWQLNQGTVWDYADQRTMGNNFTHSKIMYLVAAALTFNDTTADDPALPNTCSATRYQVCPDGTAGSLHAYWTYLTGGMLYKDWAHVEDPAVTYGAYQAAYNNLPTPMSAVTCEDNTTGTQVFCLGDGRGGESSEGSWYQYSMYRMSMAFDSIAGAGYNDPMLYGPQMSDATSSFWELKAVSDLEFLTYSENATQPRYAYFATGDTLGGVRLPSDFNAEAWMMVRDAETGRTDRTPTLLWPVLNTSVGGLPAFYANLSGDDAAKNVIPLFIALPAGDPTASSPSDPRLTLPTDWYNGGNQHIIVRSGWEANGPVSASSGGHSTNQTFAFYCPNTRIDHEHEYCGAFDVLSDGEFVTKIRTVFNDYNVMLATAESTNLAGYSPDPGHAACSDSSCFEWQAVLGSDGQGEGQLWHGQQAGTSVLQHAELPNYVAAVVDTTGMYNGSAALGWGSIQGITAASRSLIYLRNSKQVVYYDRGAGDPNAKRLWVTTTGPITIAGRSASWPTRSGQQTAYVTSLLPATAALSDAGAYKTVENGAPYTDDWEPFSHLLIDAGSPASTQFLTVMEWGGAGFAKSSTTLVASTAGQNFDGALVGSTLVMFMRSWPAAFTGVSYPASGATTQYVSDLTPGATYAITGAGAPATMTADKAGVLAFSATGTGTITVAPVQ